MAIRSAISWDASTLIAAIRVRAGSVDTWGVHLALVDVHLAGVPSEPSVRAVTLELVEKITAFSTVETRVGRTLVNV